MRNLPTLALVLTSALFAGCYASHMREEMEPVDPPPAPTCAPESSDPMVRYDVLMADDIEIEAGTRRASLIAFSLRELSHSDAEFAEYLYRFTAVTGSLTAPDGGPVFTRARLRLSDRPGRFGPYDIVATGDAVVDGEFWDANILRADDEVVLTLEVDVAEGAEGVYEIRLGDECDLTPLMRLVPGDGLPTVEMPADRIGGNDPITIRVTVTRPTARFRFCEPWTPPGPGVPEGLTEAMGYQGCCVDGGEFRHADAAEPGMLVKGSSHSVYYIASDNRRYVFPSSHHFASWHVDASHPVPFGRDASACGLVVQVPDALLASIPLGGNAPMRPGLINTGLYTLPARYVVDHGNVLRPISDATLDLNLAEPWLEGRNILTHDAIFASFTIGAFVTADYDGERLYREATLEGEVRAAHGW